MRPFSSCEHVDAFSSHFLDPDYLFRVDSLWACVLMASVVGSSVPAWSFGY